MVIDRIAKFGAVVTAGYHRVFVKVVGQNSFWTTLTASGVQQNVAQALNNYGVGYESITDVSSLFQFNNSYRSFVIAVVAQDGQSDEQVRQIVLGALIPVLTNLTTEIVSGIPNTDNGGSWFPSLPNLFGNSAGAAVAGYSVSTLVVLGVGIMVLFLLKPSYIPRRLR